MAPFWPCTNSGLVLLYMIDTIRFTDLYCCEQAHQNMKAQNNQRNITQQEKTNELKPLELKAARKNSKRLLFYDHS